MGRTKTRRYRNWRKQMRKRGQRPPRKSYTWDYMSPGRLVAYADPEPAEQQKKREQLRKMEKAMDGVGWTAAIITGLLILLVIMVQIGKRFYGW